ncbi:MAG: DUF1573 domain-containing protein [Muribaculaceae bacterium]
MKRLIIATYIIALLGIAMASAAKPDTCGLQFEEMTYDFGTIKEEAKTVVHEYQFVNTSDEAVAIIAAAASCGCTRPTFDAKPIAPGKTGMIKVTFYTRGQAGEVSKDIKVKVRKASAKSAKRFTLKLTGVVIPQDK